MLQHLDLSQRGRRQFILLATGIVLVAWGLREWFVLASLLPSPAQGDVSSYLRYAIHMAVDGVFSEAGAGQSVIPDAYRGPGYPVFLLAVLELGGPQKWFLHVYQLQTLLGAGSVALVIALVHEWAKPLPALLAGALLAVWPHNIAASNAMLVEVLFGFGIAGSLLLTTLSIKRSSLTLGCLAGLSIGASYLVNPVIALFPIMLLACYPGKGARRIGLVIALVSIIPMGAWSIRNLHVGATSNTRALQNLEQGAWRKYHFEEKFWKVDPEAMKVRTDIGREMSVLMKDPLEGLWVMGKRLARNPIDTLLWYGIQKPYLLWDWDIRMGAGGPYTLDVINSPLDVGVLGVWQRIANALNLPIFLLAAGFSLSRLRPWKTSTVTAVFFVYITLIHDVFQAEPRYAIAYRGVEMALAAGGVASIANWIRARRSRTNREASPAE